MSVDDWVGVFRSAFLGVLQGATEFLPVSSSGHLVIVPELLGWPPAGLTFDVVVHLATAIAVVFALRNDWLNMLQGAWRGLRGGSPLKDPDARALALLMLASLPAAAVGLFLEPYVESFLVDSSLMAARISAAMLLVTGTILVASEAVARRRRVEDGPSSETVTLADRLSFRIAILIGCAQAIAIIPGISRSGATIAAGLALGLPRDESARFSFLLATPIILGAGALRLFDLIGGGGADAPGPLGLLVGAAAAGIVGFGSIGWLMRTLRSRSLLGFAIYTWAFGLIALLLLK